LGGGFRPGGWAAGAVIFGPGTPQLCPAESKPLNFQTSLFLLQWGLTQQNSLTLQPAVAAPVLRWWDGSGSNTT